jgi:hypothetical protein
MRLPSGAQSEKYVVSVASWRWWRPSMSATHRLGLRSGL